MTSILQILREKLLGTEITYYVNEIGTNDIKPSYIDEDWSKVTEEVIDIEHDSGWEHSEYNAITMSGVILTLPY